MLIVENNPAKVETDLEEGLVPCPACGGAEAPPPSTGIDYLHLVEARADAELEKRISYAGIGPKGVGHELGRTTLDGEVTQ